MRARTGQAFLFWTVGFVSLLTPPRPATAAPDENRRLTGVKAVRAPSLDGGLSDPLWLQSERVSQFYQREPFEKEPATEKTEVTILYDDRYLYFGIHCFDSEPEKITATELRRDTDFSVDDHFTILISPTNDKRNGYTFTINPLGTPAGRL